MLGCGSHTFKWLLPNPGYHNGVQAPPKPRSEGQRDGAFGCYTAGYAAIEGCFEKNGIKDTVISHWEMDGPTYAIIGTRCEVLFKYIIK